MSYLSELKAGKLTALSFFTKSAGWLAAQAGVVLDDAGVDALVKKADEATDKAVPQLQAVLLELIVKSFPVLPVAAAEVIAARVSVMALEQVDTAISAAGAVIKKNN